MPALASFSLDNLTALVIGGTSGIGSAIAQGFARAGARVAIVGRNPGKMQAALARLARATIRPRAAMPTMSPTMRRLEAMLAQVLADFGHLDVLVPAQGMTILKPPRTSVKPTTSSSWPPTAAACSSAAHAPARICWSADKARSSISARCRRIAVSRVSAIYSMSKHAVIGMTLSLAAEWAGRGVRVNAISPGFFPTDLTRDAMSPERQRQRHPSHPDGPVRRTRRIGGCGGFLASPAAKFVTGTVINVDGGYLAGGI